MSSSIGIFSRNNQQIYNENGDLKSPKPTHSLGISVPNHAAQQ